jgi:hypothetical protein
MPKTPEYRSHSELKVLAAQLAAGRPAPTPSGEPTLPVPPPFGAEPGEPIDGTVVVSSALSRPLVLPPQTHEPRQDHRPASPSGVVSYQDALAAVFAQATEVLDDEEEAPPVAAPSAPTVATPEGVVSYLSSLPGHLSLESRYAAMEEELARFPNNDPSELVGDAAVQLVALRRELHKHNAEHNEAIQATRWRIELLEQELERMREQLAEREKTGVEHRRELLTKVDEMTGVIVFFDGYQAYLLQREQEQEQEGRGPQFLDNETALRLLERRAA